MQNPRQRHAVFLMGRVMGLVLAAIGLALGAAGTWLAMLGGSWYYIAAGIAFLLIGVLLVLRRPAALWGHAAFVLATLAWALWEAGFDGWPLAVRGGVLFLLGLLLLLPAVTRSLDSGSPYYDADRWDGSPPPPHLGGSRRALMAALGVFAGVVVASWFHDAHRISGSFDTLANAPVAGAPATAAGIPPGEWHAYGRTGAGQRYSPLAQITPANVAGLQPVWQYRTGDLRGQPGDPVETTFQATPLKIGNRLFFCTPHQSVIALDATTGAEAWRYNPQIQDQLALQHLTCRGLSYQPAMAAPPAPAAASPTAPAATTRAAAVARGVAPAPAVAPPLPAGRPKLPVAAALAASTTANCPAKLFMPTADGRLIALHPETGAVCTGFGGGAGQIDLWQHMPNLKPGAYYSTSPPVVARGLVIVGGTVLDNVSTQEQSGVIRAFDVNTGALVWNWDSGNPEATTPIAPGQTYTPNSPNSWSISAVDETLGMVYVPLGNQPPDQWGGKRSAAVEKYSSSIVALDLATGRVRWHFQTVHHDLWDYDVPAQPSLLDLPVGGASVPVLVQPTKQGELFVLDRRSGTPVLPVTEAPVPQGAAEGDRTAPTQPRSALSYDPPRLRGRDMWGATMFDQLYCRIAFQRLRYEGRYTPPSVRGSLVYPGNFGVFNWGGVAVDPEQHRVFATPTYLAFVSRLVPRPDDTALLVQEAPPEGSLPALNENFGAPFAVEMRPFTSPLGIPCQAPPWGYVAGADLRTGKTVWMHKNGTVRDLTPLALPFKMGVPNLGGPILTAGGVAFLSGTLDNYLRAYDAGNGQQLWQARLPAGGQATPMTYTGADGRQYVLVVAGGHGSLGTTAGDYVMAYALPP